MIYIGQAIDLKERYNKHLRNIKDLSRKEDFYNKGLREYGIENFSYEILESFEFFDQNLLNELECYYIEYYNSLKPNGYNMVPGGTNGAGLAKGKKVQQFDLKGNFITEYPSAHQASLATKISDGSICSCCNEKILYTKNCQWKYVDSDKKITDISEMIRIKSNVPIWQYDLQGNFIKEYKNFNDASSSIAVSKPALCFCLKGKTSSCAGYRWSYADSPILNLDRQNYVKKKIGQFDKENNLIKIYKNATEASKETGILISAISNATHGRTKTAGNYIWKFID